MPTVIDELIVRLGLDSSGFKRDASSTQATVAQTGNVARREGRALEEVLVKTQGETTKRMRQVEEVGRSAAQGFTRLKNEVVGLLGAIAGAYGIQQFIKNITTSDAATGYLAKTIGIAVESLSAWQEAAKRSGGSAEATGASMKTMSTEIQNFMLTGQSAMIPYLRQLQAMPGAALSLTDALGKARPVTEIYLALADRFSKMDLRRAISMGSQLGIDEGTVRLLSKGREEVGALLAQMERLGVVNQRDADAAIKLENSWASLQQAVTRLGNAILTDFNEPLVAAINSLTEWAVKARETGGALSDIEGVIRGFVKWLEEIGTGLKAVVDYMGGWKIATEVLFGLWVATKVSPIITLILGLATAMGSLATATAAVDTAAGGAGLKLLLGGGLLAGGAYGVNSALEKLEEMIYGKEFMDKDKAFRDQHSPVRDFLKRQLGWSSGEGASQGGASDERKASVRDQLAGRLGISTAAASGLVSNANAESGIRGINEANPTVPGSRGGFGWIQATGPRRIALEEYAARNKLDVASDEANIGFIEEELRTKYPNVLAQLKRGDISATEAGNLVFSDYISGRAPELQQHRAGHVAGAEAIAKLPPTVPKIGPTFGPQMAPTSAIDPAMRFALRPDAASSVDNSRSNTSTAETHIGAITVHTAATDAEGVAKGIGGALRRYAWVPESNYGLA